MPRCTECDTEYTSPLAAEECADFEREDQRRQHAWTRAHEIKNGVVHPR